MNKNKLLKNAIGVAIAIFISELAGIIGAIFTTPAITGWYASIARPDFAPPNWVFGPVWTTLFALMGISAFLVWKKGYDHVTSDKDATNTSRTSTSRTKIALGIFIFQLILNTLWSLIFFGLQSPGGAFIEIIFLWLAILATIVAFSKISRPAAWLLLPYILWVSFAGYLNYSIYKLNSTDSASQRTVVIVTGKDFLSTAYDGTYTIAGEKIKLVNGVSTYRPELEDDASSPVVTRFFGNPVNGDFDGDGRNDVAFLVTQQTGGTGTFYYALALLNRESGKVGTEGVYIGDRIAPQTSEARKISSEDFMSNLKAIGLEKVRGSANQDILIINYADRKATDSFATPPSIGKTLYLKLDPKTLQFGQLVPNFE